MVCTRPVQCVARPLHVPTRGVEATTLPKCREGGSRNQIAASQLDKGNLANTEVWPRSLYPPEEAAWCPQPLPQPRGGAGDALGPGLTPAVEAVQGTGGTGSSRGAQKASGRTEGIYRSGEKRKRIGRRKMKRMGIISLNGT